MPFKSFPGKLDGTGTTTVEIQQDNASVEWDIYQISLNGPTTSGSMLASVSLNSFYLCNTPNAVQDTATGPPDVVVARGDRLDILFTKGNPGDQVNVGIWYNENPAGTTVI